MNVLYERKVVANNLEACIKAAGLAKKEVAAAKGVTPETLSRHMHGRIQMTMLDAEDYARIIGCTVQQILFKNEPIPVIGEALITESQFVERHLHEKITHHVYTPDNFSLDRCAITWKAEQEYKGYWYEWHGAIQFLQHRPVVDKIVSPDTYQKMGAVKTKEPVEENGRLQNYFAGIIYPQPHGKFTVWNGKSNDTYENLELEWATPIISTVFRPELLGIEVYEHKDII